MSWPHILSFSRIVAGPLVAALAVATPGDSYLVAAIVFGLASITDLLDGKLARYARRESPLGVFLDTTSDKVMVSLTLIGMAVAHLSPLWIVLVIVGREFLITGLRSYAASYHTIISAHVWGKGKAALTMVAIGCVFLAADGHSRGALSPLMSHPFWSNAYTVATWLLGISAVLTVISGMRYVVDAWPLFGTQPIQTDIQGEPRRRAIAGGDSSR